MGYIVEVDLFGNGNWKQSGNKGLTGVTFGTFEEAETAKKNYGFGGRAYRITSIAAPTPKYKVETLFDGEEDWVESINRGLYGVIFATQREAEQAIVEHGSESVEYRVVPVENSMPTLPGGLRGKIDRAIISLSLAHQFLTSDMVQTELSENVGNRAGSFFKGNLDVKKVMGRTVRSKRTERKGGQISVYRSLNYTGPKVTITQFIKGYNAKTKGATA